MSDCLFCHIAQGSLEAERVAEDEAWIAIRDINPQAPTHVLVIPRRHVESLSTLEDGDFDLAGTLLRACARIAALEGIEASGYRVVANTNDDGGQTVPHLHLHVLGGRRMSWPPG